MFSVVLFPSAQRKDNEMDHMSKHGKWGEYGEAIEQNKSKSGKSPSGKRLQEDRTGTRMETLGLRLLHKKKNNNKQRNKNKHPHLHAREQKSKKLPNIFCFVLIDYFYSLNLSSYFPLLPCFCMLETQYKWGEKKQRLDASFTVNRDVSDHC